MSVGPVVAAPAAERAKPASPAGRFPFVGTPDRVLNLLVVASVVLPAAVFLLTSWRAYDNTVDGARQRLARTTLVMQEHAQKVFETQALIAGQLDTLVAGLSDDAVRAREQELHERLRPLAVALDQIQNIFLFDGQGRALVSARVFPVPASPTVADRDYFVAARDDRMPAGGFFVSELLRGRLSGDRTFQIASRRQTDAGAFAGIDAVAVEPAVFERFYGQIAGDDTNSAILFRRDGAVLARWPVAAEAGERLPAGPVMDAVLDRATLGELTGRSPRDGVERLFVYRALQQYPVLVAAGIDLATVRAAWVRTMGGHVAFGLPSVLAMVLLIVFAKQVLRRERLAQRRAVVSAERRADAESKLRHAQRIEALGQLVGGVAHDFNNVVQSVQAGVRLIRKRQTDAEIAKIIDFMEGTTERGARLIQRMLTFARREDGETETTDVVASLKGVCELLEHTLGSGYRLRCHFPAELPLVAGDRTEFETAIVNLIINGRDAMPDGGVVELQAREERPQPEDARASVTVSVADGGIGMDAATLAKASEAFFTTKAPGKGTGLGLAQARAFAESGGGRLLIASAPGSGTTVTLQLPIANARRDAAR